MPTQSQLKNRLQQPTPNTNHNFDNTSFVQPTRDGCYLKILLSGLSGLGKTWGALEIATGLEKDPSKIALIDSEAGSGKLYCQQFDYRYAEITTPFSPEHFTHVLEDAVQQKFTCVIIDSLSHEWIGEGGMLDIASSAQQSIYGGWGTATPRHNKFMSQLMALPIHVICTVRVKSEYEIVKNWKGKEMPQKTSRMIPVQKEGIEYEFTLFLQLISTGNAAVLKDRTNSLPDNISIDRKLGEKLQEWTKQGVMNGDEIQQRIDSINSSQTMDELKANFKAAIQGVPALQKTMLVAAKDRMKLELE